MLLSKGLESFEYQIFSSWVKPVLCLVRVLFPFSSYLFLRIPLYDPRTLELPPFIFSLTGRSKSHIVVSTSPSSRWSSKVKSLHRSSFRGYSLSDLFIEDGTWHRPPFFSSVTSHLSHQESKSQNEGEGRNSVDDTEYRETDVLWAMLDWKTDPVNQNQSKRSDLILVQQIIWVFKRTVKVKVRLTFSSPEHCYTSGTTYKISIGHPVPCSRRNSPTSEPDTSVVRVINFFFNRVSHKIVFYLPCEFDTLNLP